MNCSDGTHREIASCTAQSHLNSDDVQLTYPLHLHTNKFEQGETLYMCFLYSTNSHSAVSSEVRFCMIVAGVSVSPP